MPTNETVMICTEPLDPEQQAVMAALPRFFLGYGTHMATVMWPRGYSRSSFSFPPGELEAGALDDLVAKLAELGMPAFELQGEHPAVVAAMAQLSG